MELSQKNKNVVLSILRADNMSHMVINYDISNCLSLLFLQKYALSDNTIKKTYNIEVASPFSMSDSDDNLFLEMLVKSKPDLIGFSCYLWNVEATMDLCARIKKSLPHVKILLGGPEMNCPAQILDNYKYIDFVISGEGEEPFRKLLLEFDSDDPVFEDVPALSFRKQNQNVVNSYTTFLENVDLIPKIFTPGFMKEISGEVYYLSSRGCYGKCKYCLAAHGKVRYFSLDRIEEELKTIFSSKTVKMIRFQDSVINFNNKRFVKILDIITRYNHRHIPCGGYINLKNLNNEIIEKMRRACFTHLQVAIESTKDKILNNAGRTNIRKTTIQNYLKLQKDPLFFPAFNIMYLIPGDTYDGFKETIKTCISKGMRNIVTSKFRILPGSYYHINPDEDGLIFEKNSPYFLHSCRSFSAEDLKKAEQLEINTKVILNFVHESDRVFLLSHGIDIVEMAEDIHELYPDWLSLYERRGKFDTEVFCRHPNISDIIGAYIALKIENEEAATFITEILNIRKLQHVFTNNNLYLQIKKQIKPSPRKRTNILEYYKVPFSYDYNIYINNSEIIPPILNTDQNICYVAMHPTNREGCVFQSRNFEVLDKILTILENQDNKTTLHKTFNDNHDIIDMKFDNYMIIIQELCNNGLIELI